MKNRIKKTKKFSSEEISVFCDHIATLLNSGMPLYEGIFILFNEMEDTRTKELLHDIEKSLQSRMTLSQALSNTGAFPEYMVHMVSIGETAGKLEEVMHSLSEYYERDSRVKASIRSAVIFPSILFLMMAVILWALVFRILPLFEAMYNELNTEVATTSDSLMSLGVNAGMIASVIVSVLVLLAALLFVWYRTKPGEKQIKAILYKLPVTKNISDKLSVGKFISSMALMLPSGVDTRKALDLAMDSIDSPSIISKIKECKDNMDKGLSLEKAIQLSKLITGMDGNIIVVAAKSGNMDTSFVKLSERYNEKVSSLLNKIATYIETALVVLLAVLLGFILLSVMLPLVNIISSIG